MAAGRIPGLGVASQPPPRRSAWRRIRFFARGVGGVVEVRSRDLGGGGGGGQHVSSGDGGPHAPQQLRAQGRELAAARDGAAHALERLVLVAFEVREELGAAAAVPQRRLPRAHRGGVGLQLRVVFLGRDLAEHDYVGAVPPGAIEEIAYPALHQDRLRSGPELARVLDQLRRPFGEDGQRLQDLAEAVELGQVVGEVVRRHARQFLLGRHAELVAVLGVDVDAGSPHGQGVVVDARDPHAARVREHVLVLQRAEIRRRR
mmetsp:Transcript_67005/g.179097  ORF Transcript_67005/g.179097 Transcript_67005/m.179097 type:complete len:260 (-) Transcript_67005:5-784(-)